MPTNERIKASIAVVAIIFYLVPTHADPSSEELEFGRIIKEGQNLLDLKNHDEFVVLVGVTGSGKSTLAKFLTNPSSLSAQLGKGRQCIYHDNEGLIGTQTQTSKTTVPNLVLDLETGQAIVDCPGFEDTRKDPVFDIAAAFFVKRVFNVARRIKIVLVENHNSLIFYKSRDSFLRTLSHLAKLIPNAQELQGSFGLVVNKVDSTDVDADIVDEVAEFLNDTLVQHLLPQREKIKEDTNLSEILKQIDSEIAIIEAILQSENNIGVFRVPCKTKDRKACETCTDREDLRQVLFKNVKFVISDSSMFRISVSDASALFIQNSLTMKTKERFEQIIKEVISGELEIFNSNLKSIGLSSGERLNVIDLEMVYFLNFFDSMVLRNGLRVFIRGNSKIKFTITDAWENLILESDKLWFFHECVRHEIEPYMAEVKEMHAARIKSYCGIISAEIRSLVHISHFLCKIKSHDEVTTFQRSSLSSSVSSLLTTLISVGLEQTEDISMLINKNSSSHYLEQLKNLACYKRLTTDAVTEKEGVDIVVRGHYLVLSNVINQIRAVYNATYILASKALFVDSDWQLMDTHLTIVAPTIEVVGVRSLRMSGRSGTSAPLSRAAYRGQSGTDGYSSGSLRIYAKYVSNGKHWTIHMAGGDGGIGQDGSHGSDVKLKDFSEQIDIPKMFECIRSFSNVNECLFHKRYNGKYFYSLDEYNSWEHIQAYVYAKNLDSPQSGSNGGDGGLGGLPGHVILSRDVDHKFILKTRNGLDGKNGNGGRGGTICSLAESLFKCDVYRVGWTIDKCTSTTGDCIIYSRGENGLPGTNKVRKFAYNYYYPMVPSMERENQIFLEFSKNLLDDFHLGDGILMETSMHFIALCLEANEQQNYSILENFFVLVHHVAGKKLSSSTNALMKNIQDLFRSKKDYLVATENNGDVLSLEALILSGLDYTESINSKRVIFFLQSRLQSFKENANKLVTAWRDLYKQSTFDAHKLSLQMEIDSTKQYSSTAIQERIERAELELKEKFHQILEKVNKQQDLAERNIIELQKRNEEVMKSELAQNLKKRIIFGGLRLLAGVASIFQPAIGTAINTAASIGENLSAESTSESEKMTKISVPKSIAGVRKLISVFFNEKFRNAVGRREFLFSVGQQVLQQEKRLGQFMSEQTRQKLHKAINFLRADRVDSSNYDLNSVLKDCYIELDNSKFEKSQVAETKQLLKISNSASTLTSSVITDLHKVQRDSSMMDKIQRAIEVNKQTLIELESYEKSLYRVFEPYLDNMRRAYHSFTNNHEGLTQHLLLFRKIDMQKMTREFILFIRKFTAEFTDEQEELLDIVSDLEAICMAAMNAQSHVNDLQYKIQLASLIKDMGDTDMCDGSKYCDLRTNAWSTIKVNSLMLEYARLERAFQQAIFPFHSRQRFIELQPGSNANIMINILNLRVDTMVSELNERNSIIDANRDKDLNIAEFDSRFNASAPFYSWTRAKHASQIERLLNGENVTFVADVRHEKKRNAVKFIRVGLTILVPGVDLQPLLSFLELEMTHGGDSHYRCGHRFYAIASDPITLRVSFEKGDFGQPVSQNSVLSKLSRTDVPLSPYTVWTMQLKESVNARAKGKLKELAQYAHDAHLELHGTGSYVAEGASICNEDLSQHFDLFIS